MPTTKTVFVALLFSVFYLTPLTAQKPPKDFVRQLQFAAVESGKPSFGHWGDKPNKYSDWTNHSNRLVPIYTFGIKLDKYTGENSAYRDEQKLKEVFGRLPTKTLNPEANYMDQTDVYRLQMDAIAAGKKNVILMVFDGMDWETTFAASAYKNKKVLYKHGRGKGLAFQDYRGCVTDYGSFVSSPHNSGTVADIDAQIIKNAGGVKRGGYSAEFGGSQPSSKVKSLSYLIGKTKTLGHVVTDSAASATSMTTGKKTYNAAISVDIDGKHLRPIAVDLQEKGFKVGVVTSVPFCHATPACTYANNVDRNDYQDLSRDLLGLRSVSHKTRPLPGMDVIIGGGWGEMIDDDRKKQGQNFVPGNKYLTESDLKAVNSGGKYVVAQRTPGKRGDRLLRRAAAEAVKKDARLLGFFGGERGHLPYRTADGGYDPTRGVYRAEKYSKEDILENPTLEEMAIAALQVLGASEKGFWLLIEPGDVDWANHNNNIDDSIGAVLSGEAAFEAVTEWVENNSSWDDTALIVTADHGHLLVVSDPKFLTGEVQPKEVAAEPDKAVK